MIAVDARAHRRRRWLRRFLVGLAVIVMFVAFGGWLRGQDQWGPFRGQVVDAETGAPIANAHVMVSWRSRRFGGFVETLSDFFDARETVTDAQGRFEIPRMWRLWTLDVLEPSIEYFAAGYIVQIFEVQITPSDGERYVDATVVKLRPLKTREERCRHPGIPLHDKAPLFKAAVEAYILGLDC